MTTKLTIFIFFMLFGISAASANIGIGEVIHTSNGVCNGIIEFEANGSAEPFDITIVGSISGYTQTVDDYEDPDVVFFDSLCIDHYIITVINRFGCEVTFEIDITCDGADIQPIFTTYPTCEDSADGEIELVDIVGGTPDYEYVWSNGDIDSDPQNLAVGTYGVTITDANGCIVTASATVEAYDDIIISSETTNICEEGGTGSFDVSVSGGQLPYTYLWSNDETTQDVTDLPEGYYTLTVTDTRGCTAEEWLAIRPYEDMILSRIITNTCPGESTGSVDITVTGGQPPYAFLWSNGETTQDVYNIPVNSPNIHISIKLCQKKSQITS